MKIYLRQRFLMILGLCCGIFLLNAAKPDVDQDRMHSNLATTVQEPAVIRIEFDSPQYDNVITSKPVILFQGKLVNAKALFLNDQAVRLDAGGRFSVEQPLVKPDHYHMFRFLAQANEKSSLQYVDQKLVYYRVSGADKASEPIVKTAVTQQQTAMVKDQGVLTSAIIATQAATVLKPVATVSTPSTPDAVVNPLPKKVAPVVTQKLPVPVVQKMAAVTVVQKAPEPVIQLAAVPVIMFVTPAVSVAPVAVTRSVVPSPAPVVAVVTPAITVLFPPDAFECVRDRVLIKGTVVAVDILKINETIVPVKDNRFYYVANLTTPNAYHTFLITGRHADHAVSVSKRVFFKEKPVPIKIEPKQIQKPAVQKQVPLTTLQTMPGYRKNDRVQALQKQPKMAAVASVPTPQPAVVALPKALSVMPEITIIAPENNELTLKDLIMIEGLATRAREVYINGEKATLNAEGRFKSVMPLPLVGKHVFNVYALGNQPQAQQSVLLKVFRVSAQAKKPPRPKIEEKLSRRISLELEGVEIKEVLKILSKKSELNIVADNSLKGEIDLYVKDVTIKEALDHVLKVQGIAYRILGETIVVAPTAKLNVATQLKTKLLKLNNLKADKAREILVPYLTAQESVQFIQKDNAVLLTADEQKMVFLESILLDVDSKVVPQIVLVAQIVEVSSTALRRLGVSWPQYVSLGLKDGSSFSNIDTTLTMTPMMISALQEQGKAKVLAKPQIKVINEEEAEIFIGDKIPYIEVITDQTGRLTETVKFANTGIRLNILPQINSEKGVIQMKIEPEVSYVNGYRGKNNDMPIFRTRKVTTMVTVRDGETAVIGGLFNSSDSQSGSGVPILSDVPLLGELFKGSRDEDAQTELVITVTPRIVLDVGAPDSTITPIQN